MGTRELAQELCKLEKLSKITVISVYSPHRGDSTCNKYGTKKSIWYHGFILKHVFMGVAS